MATVRERMALSAVYLLSRNGYAATSFSEVLAHSGAPRGSVYHHFPGGKDELVETAIRLTLANSVEQLDRLQGKTLGEIVDAFGRQWRGILERTNCENGCTLMAVSAGAGDNERLQNAVQNAFGTWRGRLARLISDAGVAGPAAERVAAYLLAAYEGALALARAERSLLLFDTISSSIRLTALQLAQPAP